MSRVMDSRAPNVDKLIARLDFAASAEALCIRCSPVSVKVEAHPGGGGMRAVARDRVTRKLILVLDERALD